VVFRKENILERLKKLEAVIENLKNKPVHSVEQYSRDLDLQWMIERGLEVASSAILDVGNHILAGHYKVSVDEYEQILQQLEAKKVISSELYEELRGLGGFRNILVHDYLSLDHKIVYSYYKKALTVFPAFIAEIHDWLEKQD